MIKSKGNLHCDFTNDKGEKCQDVFYSAVGLSMHKENIHGVMA